MLRNRRDWQSLAYILALPLLVAYLWRHPYLSLLNGLLYGVLLFLTLGTGVIHHNHAHLRMWNKRWLNRLTDFWLTLLQGHPAFVFYPAHNGNHHRYRHGPLDVARTYRFGGDTNHLLGYLLHPLQATVVLYPLIWRWLIRMQRRHAGVFNYFLRQYLAVGLLWILLGWLDWHKFLLLVLLPQLHGLHWLLATNYLQHAHADGGSPVDFARNFEGLVNPLLFNIGFHTAHHHHPRAHWTQLPGLHQRYRHLLHPQLNPGPLLPYMFRTFILSLLWPRRSSRSLMSPGKKNAN